MPPWGVLHYPQNPLAVTAQYVIDQTVSATVVAVITVIAMIVIVITLCAESTPPLTRQLPPTKGNATPTR